MTLSSDAAHAEKLERLLKPKWSEVKSNFQIMSKITSEH
jgi:hypothetical protein